MVYRTILHRHQHQQQPRIITIQTHYLVMILQYEMTFWCLETSIKFRNCKYTQSKSKHSQSTLKHHQLVLYFFLRFSFCFMSLSFYNGPKYIKNFVIASLSFCFDVIVCCFSSILIKAIIKQKVINFVRVLLFFTLLYFCFVFNDNVDQ